MARTRGANRGFSLIEMAVVIGVMAILAGALAPLGIKALNQTREAETRRNLQTAFEHLFGSRDREVPNMRSDFAFTPNASLSDLSIMIDPGSRSGGAFLTVPPWGRNRGSRFFWGFRGPYWVGPMTHGSPADAWGRPMRLVCSPIPVPAGAVVSLGSGIAVQLQSLGPSGVENPYDNIFYPPQPVPLTTYNVQITVEIGRGAPGANLTGTARVIHAGNNVDLLASTAESPFANGDRVHNIDGRDYFNHVFNFVVPAGQIQLEFTPTGPGNFTPQIIPIIMQPGEFKQIRVLL